MTLPIPLTLAHLSCLLERGTLHKPCLIPVASLATIRPKWVMEVLAQGSWGHKPRRAGLTAFSCAPWTLSENVAFGMKNPGRATTPTFPLHLRLLPATCSAVGVRDLVVPRAGLLISMDCCRGVKSTVVPPFKGASWRRVLR